MKLEKSESGACLVFSDQGPDTRYRKRSYRIPLDKLDSYIAAYQQNFQTYLQKKKEGKIGIYRGECKMKIYIGGLYEGVCLFGHYHPVKTQKQLENVIKELNTYKE